MANELLYVPGGELTMGINQQQAEEVVSKYFPASSEMSPYMYYNECPEHKVKIPDYRISETEVTNEEFQQFVDAGGYTKKEFWKDLVEARDLNTDLVGWDRITLFVDSTGKPAPSSWKNARFPEGKANHPVDGISWFEAAAFCRWKKVRLPREAEWEFAARGSDQRVFPWGNDGALFRKWGVRQGGETTPAASVSEDKSPLGIYDMARNVAEWVEEDWYLYPNAPLDPIEKNDATGILRGGDYYSQLPEMRTTFRARTDKLERRAGIGFRYALSGAR